MADFMTVLAASQKQAASGTQGNVLAALLPGGLFESVLSTQIAAATEGEALLLSQTLPQALPQTLPQALSGEITVQAKPVAKKPALPAAVATDLPASLPIASLPIASQAIVREQLSDKPAESAEATAKSVLPATRPTLEMAATPAALTRTAGQELPQVDRLPQDLGADNAASVAVAEILLPKAAGEAPTQSGQGNGLSDPVAARQLGHFEQVARAPESRVQAAVEAPVHSRGFPAEFSEKIVWLAGRQSQVADLSLNPPQLGSLEVRLSLSGSDAGAQFYSPHPAVRDAIEAALPRLRELMAQAGITLGDTQVRDEAFARRDAEGGARASGEAASGEAIASLAPVAARVGLGLVDLYV